MSCALCAMWYVLFVIYVQRGKWTRGSLLYHHMYAYFINQPNNAHKANCLCYVPCFSYELCAMCSICAEGELDERNGCARRKLGAKSALAPCPESI